MEKRRLLVGIVLVVVVLVGHSALMRFLAKKYGWDTGQKQAQTSQPATTAPATQAEAPLPATAPAPGTLAAAPVTQPAPSITAPSSLRVVEAETPSPEARLGSTRPDDGTFAIGVTISPLGAGIDSVTLNQFKERVGSDDRYTFQRPYVAGGPQSVDATRPLTTRSITINGKSVDLWGRNWRLEGKPDATSATYVIDVGDDSGPLVRLRKHFDVLPRGDASRGYEVIVRHSLENLSSQPITANLSFSGPTPPPRELESGQDRQVIVGYNDDGAVYMHGIGIEQFTKDKATQNLEHSDKKLPMIWAGTGSVYFNALILPLTSDNKPQPPYLGKVKAEALNPDSEPHDRQVVLTFQTADLALPAGTGQSIDLPMRAFFGPKQRALLNNSFYENFPRSFTKTLIISGGCCGFLTFQPLIDLLVNLLRGFHWVLHDWGLAIIALVVLVRILLHPITKRSTISMHKMGKMGPEMERLKKKYGDNKDELNKAMMQFYKEQGATPILGCLPLFLQMPIWIALWQALQTTFELRQAPFLWGFTWIHDLAKPDALIKFGRAIPLIFGLSFSAINLLPILMAVVTWLQQKYTPKPAAATPEQLQQQKMMQWMSVLIPLMFYSMPSGLNLYYLTSTGLGIIESKRIRDHIQQREEAEKAGKVFVDAKPTRAGRKLKEGGSEKEKVRGGLAGWLADLQAKAEQMRDQGDKRKK